MDTATVTFPPRYRGARLIGHGGMGEIYYATDSVLERAVAVKILSDRYAENESVRERFTREALAAARLSGDRSIVTIFDVGEWEKRPFIVMEYMSGGTLEDRIRAGGAQPPGQAIEWLGQAARALDHAHAEGVVHRDVKPGNLLLDSDENVHVADFGIASATGTDSLTVTGTVIGTAGYFAPEQARGERATPASDRYALAAVAYELLTGRRPFESDTPTAEATAHVLARVPSVTERTGLPRELDGVFRRALAKRPDDRYTTCDEFVAELRCTLDEAAGETRPLPWATPSQRSPLWSFFIAGLAVAVIAGVVLAAALAGSGAPKQNAAPPSTTAPTTTVQAPSTAPRTTTAPPSSAPAPPDPHALNDQAYALMQQSDFGAALPLLQQSVQILQGAGPADPYEGYANYNLGYTLLQLGRCGEALTYLQRAAELEPGNKDVFHTTKRAEHCKPDGDGKPD